MVTNQLRQWRLKLSYSQLQLSVAAGVSPAMVVAIERYGYMPGADVRAKIAKALGVSEAALWSNPETQPIHKGATALNENGKKPVDTNGLRDATQLQIGDSAQGDGK